MKKIEEEFLKCDLLCFECHKVKTKIHGDMPGTQHPAAEFVHGTTRMYMEKGCRCGPCRKAKSFHRKGLMEYGEVLSLKRAGVAQR